MGKMQAKAKYVNKGEQAFYNSNPFFDQVEAVREAPNIIATGGALFGNVQPPQPQQLQQQQQIVRGRNKDNRSGGRIGDSIVYTGVYDKEYHRISRRTVKEGERLAVWSSDGRLTIIDGPAQPLLYFNVTSELIRRFKADAQHYLSIKHKNGVTEHLPGPVALFFDPINHESISIVRMINLNNDEAIVTYQKSAENSVKRTIVRGPAIYCPTPSSWVQEFEWGRGDGEELVTSFSRVRLTPEKVTVTVENVRTTDDALLTLDFLLEFQIVDLERLLGESDDPVSAFTTALCSDVISFSSTLTLENFKDVTKNLNNLETYKNLLVCANKNGCKILATIFRGYNPNEALLKLQEKSVETRTKLQLERETKQQSEQLLTFVQHSTAQRDQERREMELKETEHRALLKRLEAENANIKASIEAQSLKSMHDEQLRYLAELKKLDVDLTKVMVAEAELKPDKFLKVMGTENVHLHA